MTLKSVLVLTPIDFATEPNHRTHHVVRYLRSRKLRCIVLHYVRAFSFTLPSRMKDMITLRWPMTLREDVPCMGIDHPLNHSDNTTLTLLGLREISEVKHSRVRRVLFTIIFSLGGTLSDLIYTFTLLFGFFAKVGGRYDICLVEGPLEGVVGVILKGLGRARIVVYEDMDNFAGRMSGRFRRFYTARLEAFSIAHADAAISVGIKLAALRKAQTRRDVRVIPNGADTDLFRKAQVRLDHPPTLLYTGRVAEWSGIDKTIEAMGLLRSKLPNLRLLVVGSGTPAYEERLVELAEHFGISERVYFVGSKRYDELPLYHRQADVGLALFEPNELRKYAASLKVFEYAAGGLPVVGTCDTETEAILQHYGIGEAVEYDTQALARCIDSLFSDKEKYHSYAARARECAGSLDWQWLMEKEFELFVRAFSRKTDGWGL